jgi:hypothetical protein
MSTVNSNTSLGVISITVSSSDLENCSTTFPVTLLPAPGSGLMYNILSVDWVYNFVTTAYTGYGGNFWVASGATNNAHNSAWAEVGAGILGNTSSHRTIDSGSFGAPSVPDTSLSYFQNQSILLGTDASTGDISGGDGTLTVTLTYVLTSVF